MPAILYLIPSVYGEENPETTIPRGVFEVALQIKLIFAENIRTTRRYLKKLDKSVDIDSITFYELSKKTKDQEIEKMIRLLLDGNDGAIISEAGVPCVADPGNKLVEKAHEKNIKVIPLSGPSSIIMALIASGLNGQNFAFNGYLPVKPGERVSSIKKLENRLNSDKQTQLFMETPYRNNQLLADILKSCSGKTRLCIAADISYNSEYIKTKTIEDWKKSELPDLHKRPAIFALG
jgi:16S rRNA (cytidine1402-2'-O)-methyltransferase